MKKLALLILIIGVSSKLTATVTKTCTGNANERLDCYPEGNGNQTVCEMRNCCWLEIQNSNAPSCFFQTNPEMNIGYKITESTTTSFGKEATAVSNTASPYPNDILKVEFDAYYETENTLRLKIFDPNENRYEVPQELVYRRDNRGGYDNPDYSIEFLSNSDSFEMIKVNRGNGDSLFTVTRQNFIFSNQFLQITFYVDSTRLYGLGEHIHPFMYDLNDWQILAMWANGVPPKPGNNLYGDQAFYLMLNDDGSAHGVLLMNSNAKEVELQPTPAVTWRTIGGILDFYIFFGPTPKDVIQQYLSTISKPFMVPMWGLGFHLCRYGYQDTQDVLNIVTGLRKDNFPEETQWIDINYMRNYLDFTYDNVTFGGLPSLVSNLHEHNQKLILIFDSGIGYKQGNYPTLEEGLKKDVFIHKEDGTLLAGYVWPGPTYFPDFTANQTVEWWGDQYIAFHKKVAFDGVWNDMDEPYSFAYGSLTGCTKNKYNNPPYTPHVLGGNLWKYTICPSADTSKGKVYDTHDLYGHSEVRATFMGLRKIYKTKRSMILTRSNFVGTGTYAAHWTGDNASTWIDLLHSISQILNFNLFGIPFVGADICGFQNATTEELCIRWMQLGSFYPFMRNHNDHHEPAQDPLAFSASARAIMNTYVRIRYSLLPYLYTLFHNAHAYGTTIATPLFFNYPEDSQTYAIHDQYLLGDSVLVAPITEDKARSRNVYFPNSKWYNLVNGSLFTEGGVTLTVNAPLESIPVFTRGDSIIVTQTACMTIKETYASPFIIKYYIGKNGIASTDVYLDDGITYNAYENNDYSLINLRATSTSLKWNVGTTRTSFQLPIVSTIYVYGLKISPTGVTVNGENYKSFSYNSKTSILEIENLDLAIEAMNTINW